MASIFTKIVRREIPAYIVAEDEEFLAFLDINPQVPGHTLVIPKTEIDRIWDVPDDLLSRILLFAKPLALALEKAFPCERCAINVIGLDVPHAHMHLLPIQKASDVSPSNPRRAWTKEDFEDAHHRILEAINA